MLIVRVCDIALDLVAQMRASLSNVTGRIPRRRLIPQLSTWPFCPLQPTPHGRTPLSRLYHFVQNVDLRERDRRLRHVRHTAYDIG